MRRVPLKYIAAINAAVLPESTSPDFTFAYIDIGSVSSTGSLSIPDTLTSFADAPSRARRLASRGATVVSTVRTYLRAIARAPSAQSPLVFSTGFAVLEAGQQVDSGYLYYACRTDRFVDEVVARSTGVSYPAINPSELGSISVPLPSLEDQRRIADFLDHQVALLDRAIALRQGQVSLEAERLESRLRHLLAARAQEHWVALRRLGVAVTTGPFGTVFSADEYVVGGVPMINPVHIRDGQLVPEDHVTVEASRANTLQRYALRAGDLVISRKGDIGRAALVTRESDGWLCGSDSIALRLARSGLLPEFAWHLLRLPEMREQLLAQSLGATMPSLNEPNLLGLRVPLPGRDEQQYMAKKASELVAEQHATTALMMRSLGLLRERKQALIAAAVTGQLDVMIAGRAA